MFRQQSTELGKKSNEQQGRESQEGVDYKPSEGQGFGRPVSPTISPGPMGVPGTEQVLNKY